MLPTIILEYHLLEGTVHRFFTPPSIPAAPLALKAGTIIQAVVAWFDNSRNNPHNPDPTNEVRWGDQTSDEIIVGFFNRAVPAGLDKRHYFIRHPAAK